METRKLIALVISFSLLGIFGLYAYAVSIEAKTQPIADIDSKDLGSLVEVEGYIKEVKMWQDGDLSLVLADYESGESIDVNVDAGAVQNLLDQEKMVPGAKVKVSGLVEDYKGELLIHVMSSEGVIVTQQASTITLPLNVILERPEVFEGIEVKVRGTVWEIEEIESLEAITFTLQNSSEGGYYSVSCIVFNMTRLVDMNDKSISQGSGVIFSGNFEYYAQNGIWQIQTYEGKESLDKVD
jgi:DNA/RNA endonuclease YhcR with UshA esterase domain